MRKSVFLLAFALTVTASPQMLDSKGKSMVSIGAVRGMGPSSEHVYNLLRLKGIESGSAGSHYYGIFVSQRDIKIAKSILREDGIKHPWIYETPESRDSPGSDTESKLLKGRIAKGRLLELNIDLMNWQTAEVFRTNGLLRGVAREISCTAPIYHDTLQKGSRIKSMLIWEMPYMDRNFNMQKGVYAEVRLQTQRPSVDWVYRVYSWNGGKEAQCAGGNGTGLNK